MEFDQMQKIWNTQSNEFFYGINEKTLYKNILSKKKQASHITNISELLSIIVNGGAGFIIFALFAFKASGNIYMYCLSAWMLFIAVYLMASRIRRIKSDARFDRSIRGDLDHAISSATYQVRLSQLMRLNILPIGILTLLGANEAGKSPWLSVGIMICLVLTNYASGWEHGIYKAKKRKLEILKDKLASES